MNEDKIKVEVANLIKEGRLKAGLTQEEVADRMGVARQSYSQYENGIKAPGAIQFMYIFEAMGLDPAEEMDKLAKRIK